MFPDIKKLQQIYLGDKTKWQCIWETQQNLTCSKREENEVPEFKIVLCVNLK